MKSGSVMKSSMKRFLFSFTILFLFGSIYPLGHASEKIVVFGEYPVAEEIKDEALSRERASSAPPLIMYGNGKDYREKALIEGTHFLNASVYGYTFYYKPGSFLMKTEEVFDVALRGEVTASSRYQIGEGVYNAIYRVKLEFPLNPSVERWLSAFHSNTLRLTEAEGTSDFYSGWEGRSDAYREALRNLVLVAAKKRLSSRPLSLKGDILLTGTPSFSVGAGRHYCKIQGFVNVTQVITYD